MTAATFDVGSHQFAVEDLGSGDAADVIALHRHVFQSSADESWYRWKYLAGRSEAAGVRNADGELIAHCGGVPRQMSWRGRKLAAIQIGDVMVAPRARGLLTRRGPFFQVSRHFYESRVGHGKPFELAFGFPSERHLRLGVHLGVLHDGGSILELQWAAAAVLPWRWRCSPLAPRDPDFDAAISSAWRRMETTLGEHPAGCRNAEYLRWRYVDRPDCSYLLFALHRAWSRKPVGIVVLRRESPERMAWLDWIGPLDFLPIAAQAARTCAAREGAQGLACWASPAIAAALANSGIAASNPVARLGIPTPSLLSPADIAAASWWWMGGDTDFL